MIEAKISVSVSGLKPKQFPVYVKTIQQHIDDALNVMGKLTGTIMKNKIKASAKRKPMSGNLMRNITVEKTISQR